MYLNFVVVFFFLKELYFFDDTSKDIKIISM